MDLLFSNTRNLYCSKICG